MPPHPQEGKHAKARLVVTEQVYHQIVNGEPTVTESRFQRWLQTDEQPYKRLYKVGTEWKRLDTGWIEKASLLCIENIDKKQILFLSCRVSDGMRPSVDWYIPPGCSLRGTPSCLQDLSIRALEGEASLQVTVFPL